MISHLIGLFQGFRQDLRSKELRLLLLALVLSVAALTSVSFLADRLQRAFEFDARQLIASDLLIAADQPLPENFIKEAEQRGLQIALTIVFPSMASTDTLSKLASIKAVSSTYPLRGQLKLELNPDNLPEGTQGPKSGTVWVEPSLLSNLDAKPGQSLRLGDRQFVIAGVITRELDRGAGFMNFAPRVMMSLDDLASTGLIGLGSRVTYRLLLAGDDTQVKSYQAWLRQDIESKSLRGIRIETLETAQPTMRKTLDRAEQFLSLVSLLTAMIAAVAIGLSAYRYMQKQADTCAVLKCFGATRAIILGRQLKTLLSLGLIATLLGSLFAYAVQSILTGILGNLLLANLPEVSAGPILWSAVFSWLLLIGFASYPLMSLINVSPIRLIRKEFEINKIGLFWLTLLGLGFSGILIWIAARDWKLALWVAISFAAAILIFAVAARLVLWITSKIEYPDFAGRFAVMSIGRRPGFAVMQITALGIAIMALLMILLLRQDLLKTWQGNIPANVPNRFMINIQEDQKLGITKLLESRGIAAPNLYPMVRGRLIAVNGRNVLPADYADENAKRLVDREFNLSYTDDLPPNNRIVSGKWISGDAPQISMESGIAKTLKLQQGDLLTFEVAGEQISAPITSLRKLDWGSMRVNFFVIMPPAMLSKLPQSWITSYYQDPQAPSSQSLDFDLSKSFPNLTLVDVSASLQQIQEVLDKLSGALGLLFGFTILAAILVLLAALSATQDERYRNAALLKAIGASRVMLARIAAVELLIIGLVSGLLAGLTAGIAAWALGRYVMEIEFNAFIQSTLIGLGFGIAATLVSGYTFLSRIQNATAIECLREI